MEKIFVYDGKEFSKSELEKRFNDYETNYERDPDQRLKPVIDMIEGEKVLDVGCAGGEISKQISKKKIQVHGIDILEESIQIAKQFNSTDNTTFEVRDLLLEPFPPESFDCVIFLETIEHVDNPMQYLKEFFRILKPGGCVMISTPNATSLKNILYALSYNKKNKQKKIIEEIKTEQKNTGTQLEHIFNWDFPTLVRLIDKSGFEVVEHVFARSGPIIIPFFGKRIEIIKVNSNFLKKFPTLMTTHVIKARKPINQTF